MSEPIGLDGWKDTMNILASRSETAIKCDKCGHTVSCRHSTPQGVAEQAYFNHGWRVQNGQMLCRYCTEDKR